MTKEVVLWAVIENGNGIEIVSASFKVKVPFLINENPINPTLIMDKFYGSASARIYGKDQISKLFIYLNEEDAKKGYVKQLEEEIDSAKRKYEELNNKMKKIQKMGFYKENKNV